VLLLLLLIVLLARSQNPGPEPWSELPGQFWFAAAAWGVAGTGIGLIVLGLCVPLAPGSAAVQEQLRVLLFAGVGILGFGMLILGFTCVFQKLKIELPGMSFAAAVPSAVPRQQQQQVLLLRVWDADRKRLQRVTASC
jgi:hypothetical protein